MTRKAKMMILIIELALLLPLVLVGLTSGFLTNQTVITPEYEMGRVEVGIEVYFERPDGTIKSEGIYYTPVEGITKTGVYAVNISDSEDFQYIENLRVNVIVKSNVLTYFRIAVYEQLTMTYISNGKIREVAVTHNEYTKLNYAFADIDEETSEITKNGFYDSRMYDGYLYYTNRVMRNQDETNYVIPLVTDYFENEKFTPYGKRYSLQIGFIIDAVQALQGAEHNWGTTQTPWGSTWSW